MIQGSLGEHIYSVGSAIFPAMTADEAMIMEIFQDLQLQVLKWELSNSNLTTHYFCLLKKSWEIYAFVYIYDWPCLNS